MEKELKNLIINFIHDRELKRCSSTYLTGRLIDIGCGKKPYKDLLAPYVTEHIRVDHQENLHDKSNIDRFGTAYDIPAENGEFDSVICTAVLEHLEEPEQALRECHCALKQGGIAIYSVSFIWYLHEEPRDFRRFSKYGLKYLVKKAGFEIIKIESLSAFLVTFGQLLFYNIFRFNRGPFRYIPIIPALGLIIQLIRYIIDRLDKTEQWMQVYMAVVRKP